MLISFLSLSDNSSLEVNVIKVYLVLSYLISSNLIKWKHFPRYWPFVRGIHRSPVNSPHKGQRRGALMFSLIWAWINGWVNNGGDGWFETPSRPLWRYCNVFHIKGENRLANMTSSLNENMKERHGVGWGKTPPLRVWWTSWPHTLLEHSIFLCHDSALLVEHICQFQLLWVYTFLYNSSLNEVFPKGQDAPLPRASRPLGGNLPHGRGRFAPSVI